MNFSEIHITIWNLLYEFHIKDFKYFCKKPKRKTKQNNNNRNFLSKRKGFFFFF